MGDVVQVSWADVLRIEGVDAKGYGSIPKLIMTDPEIPYRAKAIYAYFCSHAGDGTRAFPGRSTILHDLSLSKDSYYSNFKVLERTGYISVQKRAGESGQFPHNVYTLERNPKKLADYVPPSGDGSRLRTKGIKAGGYGDIPRMVMTDARISLKGKALYAYFASFSGAGDVAFPKQQDILYHMNISASTYQKAIKELVALNYIEVEQQVVNGRFAKCLFYLCDNPDEAKGAAEIERRQKVYADRAMPTGKRGEVRRRTPAAEASAPHGKKKDTVDPVDLEGIQPHGKKPDTAKSDMGKPDMEKSDTGKQDTTINSFTINSFTNISHSISEPSNFQKSATLELFDELIDDDEKREYIKRELLGFPLVPRTVHLERYQTDVVISYNEEHISLLVDLIVECSHLPQITVGGQSIPRAIFMERFLDLGLDDLQYVVDSVSQYVHSIKNLKNYYITSLYNAKQFHALSIQAQLSKDSGAG